MPSFKALNLGWGEAKRENPTSVQLYLWRYLF